VAILVSIVVPINVEVGVIQVIKVNMKLKELHPTEE
jgi:hypothetical protein